MSDHDEHETEQADQPKRNFRRELEDQIDSLKNETSTLKRENAIYKAGLGNLTERQIRTLARDLDETNLSKETILEAASELGWAQVEKPAPVDDLSDIAAASAGAITDPGPVGEQAAYEAALNAARSGEEVTAIMAKYGRLI